MSSNHAKNTWIVSGDRQRLKEAVWRVQGLVAKQPRMARWRQRIIDGEMVLIAETLGVEALQS